MQTFLNSFQKLMSWLKNFNSLPRVLIIVLVAAIVAIVSLSSCGSTTKATIRNFADSTQTTVTITTNNPTDFDVSPDVSLAPIK